MSATGEAAAVGQRIFRMKGSAGMVAGGALLILIALVLYFTMKPLAATIADRVTSAGSKLAASAKGAVAGTNAGSAGSDPRLEGL